MNWKYLRCTEDVFLEIPLSLVPRRLNFKSLEMFSQRGGKGGSALCLTHGLAGRNARGDCLFPWYAYYPDIYPTLINTDSTLLVLLLFHILNFFLSCKWRHTCEYKYQYVPVEVNMYCYVHPLLKTAAHCTEDRKLGVRNIPGLTFYCGKWNLYVRECKGVCTQGPRHRGVSWAGIRGTFERPQEGAFTSWTCHGIGCGPWLWGCNHTDDGQFRGHTHMRTVPEIMSNQNATNWFALRSVAVKLCSRC